MRFILFTLCIIGSIVSGYSQTPYSLFIQQINATVDGVNVRYVGPSGTTPNILTFDSSDNQPHFYQFQGGIVLSGTTFSIDGSRITGIAATQISGLPNGTVTSVALSSTNLTISGTVTSTGDLSVNLPPVGAASSYSGVTTDVFGRVISGNVSTSSVVNRVSGTAPTSFQPSTTQNTLCVYNVSIANSVNIISLTSVFGQVELQTSSNKSTWTTQTRVRNATTVGLAIALSLTDTADYSFSAFVPAGYFVRLLRTGAGTFTDLPGQETKL